MVSGSIDRIDYDPDGRALLIDYKLGKPPEIKDVIEGKELQFPLYWMAMESVFKKEVASLCYDSPMLPGRPRIVNVVDAKKSRYSSLPAFEEITDVRLLSRDQKRKMMVEVQNRVYETVDGIVSGRVRPTPGKHCGSCRYGDVCRTSLNGVHDGEPMEWG